MQYVRALIAVVAVASMSVSCTVFRDLAGSTKSVTPPEFTAFDPKAEPVSPGADGVSQLREVDPEVPDFGPQVEAAERAAIRQAIAELSFKQGDGGQRPLAIKMPTLPALHSGFITKRSVLGAFMMLAGGPEDNFSGRKTVAGIITAMIGGLKGMMSEWGGTGMFGAEVNKEATQTKDGATSTMGLELKANQDGTSTFGIKIKTVVEGKGEVEFTGRIIGTDCPDAKGEVNLDVNTRISAISGGSGYTQDLKGTIKAVVGDDANVASAVMDLNQGTREVRKGKGIYLETAYTLTQSNKDYTISNWKLVRNSQDSMNDVPLAQKSAESGEYSAMSVGIAALTMAEYHWQKGGCVKIDAKSPGRVEVNSTTDVPVKVTHKLDGTDVPSKLDMELTGGSSIDPTTIAKSPGTFAYVAPGEQNKPAKIKITATSRRGKAELTLDASTGNDSYTVSATSNGVLFSGKICSLSKPFTIDAKFPGGTAVTTFSPGGSTSVSGGGGGCKQTGGGTYSVDKKSDGSATLNWTSSDTVTCPMFSNSRTASFSVPLTPAPELSCN